MYKGINRDALVITAKKPYRDWCKWVIKQSQAPQYYPNPDACDNISIYLIHEQIIEDNLELYVKSRCENIFKHELEKWEGLEEFWPEDMSWEAFIDWFDYIRVKGINDVVDGGIQNYNYDEDL